MERVSQAIIQAFGEVFGYKMAGETLSTTK